MMLKRERRRDYKVVDRWTTRLLLEAGAIHECPEHGWAKDRTDPHAREEAFRIAREEPLAGLSPTEAVIAVQEALQGVGDTCPESDSAANGNPGRVGRLSRRLIAREFQTMAPRANWKGFLKLSLVTCHVPPVSGDFRDRKGHLQPDQQADGSPHQVHQG
jgi:hypothetical protein